MPRKPSGTPEFACPTCAKPYTRQDNLTRHIKRKHGAPEPAPAFELPEAITAGDLFAEWEADPTRALTLVWQGEKRQVRGAIATQDGTINLRIGIGHFIGVPKGTPLTVIRMAAT